MFIPIHVMKIQLSSGLVAMPEWLYLILLLFVLIYSTRVLQISENLYVDTSVDPYNHT